jgi:hypothetical protein
MGAGAVGAGASLIGAFCVSCGWGDAATLMSGGVPRSRTFT